MFHIVDLLWGYKHLGQRLKEGLIFSLVELLSGITVYVNRHHPRNRTPITCPFMPCCLVCLFKFGRLTLNTASLDILGGFIRVRRNKIYEIGSGVGILQDGRCKHKV